ncbi:MAG: sugar phosphate isomerase/epimerase [Victivallales bacterium]|nr:sugar phosphate isomerase/epimerase [Victivallales bacterium]
MEFSISAQPPQFEAIAAAGFKYVDPHFGSGLSKYNTEEEFQALGETLKRTGLTIWGSAGLFPKTLHLVGPDANLEEAIDFIHVGMKRAEAYGTKVVVFGSGDARRIPVDFDPREAYAQLVALGKAIAPIAQEHGVKIAVENLNCNETNTFTSLASTLKYVQDVGHPAFQLLIDIFHFQRSDRDLLGLANAGPHLIHAHIATYDNRRVPGVEECDFSANLHELKRIGYEGAITIEANSDWTVECLHKALETLRDAWETA